MCAGGVMKRLCLFPLMRKKCQALLNGYIQAKRITGQSHTHSIIHRIRMFHVLLSDVCVCV